MNASDPIPWLDRSLFARRAGPREARRFCRRLAQKHYENFTVISFLLPRALRQHFANVYAYCRVADDLADELENPELALDRLLEWEHELDRCFRRESRHPVFVALEESAGLFNLPREPFVDLLTAFRQDQVKTRYETWEELLAYCRHSANPVGRLVLYLCGYRDEERHALGDFTCTALQLTNFWQDVTRDYARGRIYIPEEVMELHGCGEQALARGLADEAWRSMMADLVGRTRALFVCGAPLAARVRPRLRFEIELFTRGGLEILRTIEDFGYNTLRARPTLSRWQEARIAVEALAGVFAPRSQVQGN